MATGIFFIIFSILAALQHIFCIMRIIKCLLKNRMNDDYFIGNWAENCVLHLLKVVRIMHKLWGISQRKWQLNLSLVELSIRMYINQHHQYHWDLRHSSIQLGGKRLPVYATNASEVNLKIVEKLGKYVRCVEILFVVNTLLQPRHVKDIQNNLMYVNFYMALYYNK